MMEQYLSPAELRRLVSALLAVLGLILLAALFAFLVLPGMRYQANTAQQGAVEAVQGQSGWLDPTEVPAGRKQVIPPVDPKTVMSPTPELLARGKVLFAKNCVSCHGESGHGDGPGGKGLKPAPRNFSTSSGWTNGFRIEDIFKTLTAGVPNTSMVSYNYLGRKDRMALVHYVQGLGSFDHGKSDPQARAALEQQFRSGGEVIPNHIPVRVAVSKLVEEDQLSPSLRGYRTNPLLREVVLDPARAARTLAGVPGWQDSDRALADGLVPSLPLNGFSPSIATFAPDRWTQLRIALAHL